MSLTIVNFFKVFSPTTIAFFIGILITIPITSYLYSNQMWKKKAGKIDPNGQATPIFDKLHQHKEVGTPRMGGVVIWASVLITTILFWLAGQIWPQTIFEKLNFLSREQTWLPLFTLITASIIGLVDDLMQVKSSKEGYVGGLHFSKRLLLVSILGVIGAYWFYIKLGVNSLHIPFYGDVYLGLLIIPLFILVMIALFSSSVIDGLDGLSGGVMATIFAAYAGVAFLQNQIDIAALCAVITGGTLAFLWFNIPPARFYMSETGILGLTTTLTVIAFLTDTVFTLPIIAFPLVATSASDVIQITSKKLRKGKKVFLIAPLHHHFEAMGWPAYKVVMRYWIIGIIAAVIGMVISVIGG